VTSAITLLNPHSLSLSLLLLPHRMHHCYRFFFLSTIRMRLCVLCLSVTLLFYFFFWLMIKIHFFTSFSQPPNIFFFLNKPFLTRWAWWLRWGLYLLIPTFFFNILAYWVMWFLFWAGFCSFIFSHKAFSFSGNSDVGWFFYEVFPLLVCINEIFIGHESSLKPILFLWVSWFL
jgi:hypothetical protein